jgi:hypothetical protein
MQSCWNIEWLLSKRLGISQIYMGTENKINQTESDTFVELGYNVMKDEFVSL